MSERITISPADIEKAITVWLRVMPNRIWREVEKYELAAKEKRANPGEKPDPKAAVASYIAAKFIESKWDVSREKPFNEFADKV